MKKVLSPNQLLYYPVYCFPSGKQYVSPVGYVSEELAREEYEKTVRAWGAMTLTHSPGMTEPPTYGGCERKKWKDSEDG